MYDIPAYYIHPTVDGELCWHNASSDSSDSEDMLNQLRKKLQEDGIMHITFQKITSILLSMGNLVVAALALHLMTPMMLLEN